MMDTKGSQVTVDHRHRQGHEAVQQCEMPVKDLKALEDVGKKAYRFDILKVTACKI